MKAKAAPPVQPYILALETATQVSSVALFEGGQLKASLEYHGNKRHASLLTPMINTLLEDLELKPSDLSAIGVAKGPGSYTGLRVGVSAAKGLCLALDLPLLTVGSLEALAWQLTETVQPGDYICPMIDARRMEVYTRHFDADIQPQNETQALIIEADAFREILDQRTVWFLGDGAMKCKETLEAHPNARVLCNFSSSARSMGTALWQRYQAGSFEDLVAFEPFYLKDFVATKGKNLLK